MKTRFTLVMLILMPLAGLRAQMPIVIAEDYLQFGNSSMSALSVTIPEVEYDVTLKEWIKSLESGTKSKVVTESSGMSIFGARLKDISVDPINVYSTFDNTGEVLKLIAAFELRKDNYIERATSEADYLKAEAFIKDFAKARYLDLVKAQLNDEEKKLHEIERQLSSLDKNNSKMQRRIESGRNTIQSENDRLISLNNELASINSEIEQNNLILATSEAGDARDEKLKYMNDLNKRKKRIMSSIQSAEKKIAKANDAITGAQKDIPGNERDQVEIREEIAAQDAVVQQFTNKFNTIRNY
ncbi:MAG: hypothetical protein RBU28_00180 [Bacteroidales bacterium]|jgi:predicted  nucleic acid-binding Zn-ribbon protein|nr:hypothetical protein [Bacteroidales bacterium]